MASRAEFDIYGDLLVEEIIGLDALTERRVEMLFRYMSDAALAYAKVNAPWTDRTGAARSGLGSDVETDGQGGFGLTLFHRVTYGIYLETKYAARDAIILPTLNVFGPRVMNALSGLWDRMGR